MQIANFLLGGKITTGDVIKENTHTIWVRIPALEGKTKIIQRHRSKHLVIIMNEAVLAKYSVNQVMEKPNVEE